MTKLHTSIYGYGKHVLLSSAFVFQWPPNESCVLCISSQVQAYNNALRQMCGAIGLPFFDTFSATFRAASFDGLHYGMDANLLKAQLLVNFLESTHKGVL